MPSPDRDAFLEAHLPLVKKVFARLRIGLPPQAAGQLEDDLLGAGALGLLQAYEKYDGRDSATFATFAAHRIRGAMLDELRRNDWLSKQSRHRLKEIQQAFRLLEQKLGRPAGEDELAAHLRVDVDRLREELVEIGPATLVFLEGLGADREGGDWKNFIADPGAVSPEEQAQRREVFERLKEAVGRLPEQERSVLALLLDEGLGQTEIADLMGVSPSRVSQIHSKAVARLQAALAPLFAGQD